jgi:hypothetical protein
MAGKKRNAKKAPAAPRAAKAKASTGNAAEDLQTALGKEDHESVSWGALKELHHGTGKKKAEPDDDADADDETDETDAS